MALRATGAASRGGKQRPYLGDPDPIVAPPPASPLAAAWPKTSVKWLGLVFGDVTE